MIERPKLPENIIQQKQVINELVILADNNIQQKFLNPFVNRYSRIMNCKHCDKYYKTKSALELGRRCFDLSIHLSKMHNIRHTYLYYLFQGVMLTNCT